MKLSLLILTSLLSLHGWAVGHDQGGGGDLCEDRIKIVRDDFVTWINDGGPRALSLPSYLDVDQYSSLMLEQMKKAKIRCVSKGDEGFPVQVQGIAKTCRFDRDLYQGLITCDYDKFRSLRETDQYILIHHEYAGLAQIENPNGDDSNYDISNQISRYLEDRVTKKLVVRPNNPNGPDPFNSNSCVGTPMTENEAFRRIPLPNQTQINIGTYKIYLRTRLCYKVDGCTNWSEVAVGSSQYLQTAFDDSPWMPSLGALRTEDGKIGLRLKNDRTELVLAGTEFKQEWTTPEGYPRSYVWSLFFANPFENPVGREVRMLSDRLEKNNNAIRFPGNNHFVIGSYTLTNNCLRITSQGKQEQKDSSGNTTTSEYQSVILGVVR